MKKIHLYIIVCLFTLLGIYLIDSNVEGLIHTLKGYSSNRIDKPAKPSSPSVCDERISFKDKGDNFECLSVETDNMGNQFVAPPSVNIVKKLGFEKKITNAEGKKYYASSSAGSAGNFVGGREAVLFTKIAKQDEQWCDELSKIGFAGKYNWRVPNQEELTYFFKNNADSFEAQHWPSDRRYWTSTETGEEFFKVINLRDLHESLEGDSSNHEYVSCVSPMTNTLFKF